MKFKGCFVFLSSQLHRPATTMLEEAMPSIIRSRSAQVAMPTHNTQLSYLNVTQVRVVYEVRIFEKMHMTDSEVMMGLQKVPSITASSPDTPKNDAC
eukprot:5467591-Amphidinium_carterae.1